MKYQFEGFFTLKNVSYQLYVLHTFDEGVSADVIEAPIKGWKTAMKEVRGGYITIGNDSFSLQDIVHINYTITEVK